MQAGTNSETHLHGLLAEEEHPEARLSSGVRPLIYLAEDDDDLRVALAELFVHDGFAGIGTSGWAGTLDAYERGADKHQVLRRLAELVTTASV